jgi:ferrous iron transport protein B
MSVARSPADRKTLVLLGNPNVGKSVIFGRLTGKYATVSNYPGTTVEVSSGVSWLAGEAWRVVDTPGVNSLYPSSEDERVTRDFLLKDRPEVVLNVLDSKNLARGLMTSLELAEFGIPTGGRVESWLTRPWTVGLRWTASPSGACWVFRWFGPWRRPERGWRS